MGDDERDRGIICRAGFPVVNMAELNGAILPRLLEYDGSIDFLEELLLCIPEAGPVQ